MGMGMGLNLVIIGAPVPREQLLGSVHRAWRFCFLKPAFKGPKPGSALALQTATRGSPCLRLLNWPGWGGPLLRKGPTFWPQPLLRPLRNRRHISNSLRENLGVSW